MNNLPQILDSVINELDEIDEMREKLLALTRKLNRVSGRGIALLVMGESADEHLNEANMYYGKLKNILDKVVRVISWKSSISGVEEYAEFSILYSLIKKDVIPSPLDLDLPSWVWLPALGDVTGELRRIILNRLMQQKDEEAKNYLSYMQSIYREISGLSFTKSILPSFRKKVDVARASIERTESDVFNYFLRKVENK